MTREEMREKIADIFAKAEYGFPFREIIGHSRTRMLNSADAAIAIVRAETLEEAARVARGADKYSTMATSEAIVRTIVSDEIRALARPNNGLTEPSAEVSAIP